MATRDALNQFAKKPPQHKAAVLLFVLGTLGLFYYQFMYSGLDEEKAQLEGRRGRLLNKQRQLNKDLEEQKRLSQQHEELQRSIRDNQKALPTEAELPAFFDHLQRKAGDAGVTIRRWQRREEEDVDIYTRVPVEMEISGTFYNIMEYFALLGPQRGDEVPQVPDDEKERVDERIVSIEDLELGKASLKDGEIHLVAKFVASTFRQQGPTGGAAGNGAKAGGAAAAKGRRGRRR